MEKSKIVFYKSTRESQINLAIRRRSENDFIGALNILKYLTEINPKDYECYELMAKVYMDMEYYRLALSQWFKFLNICPKREWANAYNGIATCFLYLDNLHLAGYYYDMQLGIAPDKEFDYTDELYDYIDFVKGGEEPEFYITYPYEKMSVERRLELSEELIFKDPKEYLTVLNSIDVNDEKYIEAQTRIVAFYILNNKINKAKKVINELIAQFPDEPLVKIVHFMFLAEMDDLDNAIPVLESLKDVQFTSYMDSLKVATECMAVGLYGNAKHYCEITLNLKPYSIMGLFTMGAICFNMGDYEQAEKYFLLNFQLTGISTVKYYLDITKNPKQRTKIGNILPKLKLPESVAKAYLVKILKYTNQGFPKITNKNIQTMFLLFDFIASFPNNAYKQFIDGLVGTKNKAVISFLKDKLLDSELNDEIKYTILEGLVINDFDGKISVVHSGIFNKTRLFVLKDFERKGEQNIIKTAHAKALAKVSTFAGFDTKALEISARVIYQKLCENGNILMVENLKALALAIALSVDNVYTSQRAIMTSYFGTDKKSLNTVLKLIKAKHVDS